ncbi:YcfL family protein [Aeromonas enteropelogenes]|uniref:YcfL family protein n=1 Tax=Aeromonas enteropelogenes TaxID=29489 RepID=A0ABU9JBD1_AEREN|nr:MULTISPECIES: YcfL family protein [Aeromonas]MBL0519973.1 YcfL family protein [Aeromonas enteropelogenes]QXC32514.1 YcfL family protein [Aeromonas sp. FDAARGOS 1407]UBH29464.1 YcfL family protein [Aeromonas enteropelogenes]UBH51120.1 YcfL family protein [Aeromonas enteropelogenes]UBH57524.1 YcfL family protein [Aeromonas enteropelogenes]
MKRCTLALGLALLLTGCATNTSGIALYGAAGAAAVAEQHQNVNVTLTELSRREQNGLLQVNVAATSTQRSDNRLQYLFYWYDEAGQEVASDGRGWTPLKLHGYQSRTLSALAPSPAARGYRLYVREVIEESY